MAEESKKLSAKELVGCIRNGMTDAELMQRYDLSEQKLQVLFKKLIEMRALSKEEFQLRSATQSPAPQAQPLSSRTGTRDVIAEFAERFKVSNEDLERLKAASLKDLKEILDKYDIPQEEGAKLLKAYGGQAGAVASEATQRLMGSLKELISAARTEGDEEARKAALEAISTKPLAIGSTALLAGWFLADVFTSGWFLFLALFLVFTVAAFVGGFFLAEKSKFRTKLGTKHFAILAAIFLVLNVVSIGGDRGGSDLSAQGKVVTSGKAIQTTWDELETKYKSLDIGQSELRYLQAVPTIAPKEPTYVILSGKFDKYLDGRRMLMRHDYRVTQKGITIDTGTHFWIMRLPEGIAWAPSEGQPVWALGLVTEPGKLDFGFWGSTKTATTINALAVRTFMPDEKLYY